MPRALSNVSHSSVKMSKAPDRQNTPLPQFDQQDDDIRTFIKTTSSSSWWSKGSNVVFDHKNFFLTYKKSEDAKFICLIRPKPLLLKNFDMNIKVPISINALIHNLDVLVTNILALTFNIPAICYNAITALKQTEQQWLPRDETGELNKKSTNYYIDSYKYEYGNLWTDINGLKIKEHEPNKKIILVKYNDTQKCRYDDNDNELVQYRSDGAGILGYCYAQKGEIIPDHKTMKIKSRGTHEPKFHFFIDNTQESKIIFGEPPKKLNPQNYHPYYYKNGVLWHNKQYLNDSHKKIYIDPLTSKISQTNLRCADQNNDIDSIKGLMPSWQYFALGLVGFFVFFGNPVLQSLNQVQIKKPLMELLDTHVTSLSIFLLKCEKNTLYKSLTAISNKIFSLALDQYHMLDDHVTQSTWQVKLFYAIITSVVSGVSRYYYINSDEYRYSIAEEDIKTELSGSNQCLILDKIDFE